MSDPGSPLTPSLVPVAVLRRNHRVTEKEMREVEAFLSDFHRDEKTGTELPAGWDLTTHPAPTNPVQAISVYTCSFCGRETKDFWEIDPCENCGGRTGISEATP
jgi:hypothetical protein